jgi:hypothetical protein
MFGDCLYICKSEHNLTRKNTIDISSYGWYNPMKYMLMISSVFDNTEFVKNHQEKILSDQMYVDDYGCEIKTTSNYL